MIPIDIQVSWSNFQVKRSCLSSTPCATHESPSEPFGSDPEPSNLVGFIVLGEYINPIDNELSRSKGKTIRSWRRGSWMFYKHLLLISKYKVIRFLAVPQYRVGKVSTVYIFTDKRCLTCVIVSQLETLKENLCCTIFKRMQLTCFDVTSSTIIAIDRTTLTYIIWKKKARHAEGKIRDTKAPQGVIQSEMA